MMARIIKHCIVIVLDMLSKHTHWPLPLTYISRSIDYQNFMSPEDTK